MKRVQRRDAGTLAAPQRTAEGFLRVDGVIAKCGVLEYTNPDGSTRRELVTPEELFDPESMRSFAVLALTNTHPEALLTPDTVKAHIIGTVGEPRRDGELLCSMLGVLTADAIAAVDAGRSSLSSGYDCELDETAGVHITYGPYDAIQRQRRGNHVAVVDVPRAGVMARMRLDADGNACVDGAAPRVVASETSPTGEGSMKIKIGVHHFDANDASASLIQQAIEAGEADAKARLDAAAAAAAKVEQARADAVAKFDALMKRHAALCKSTRTRLDVMKARMMGCDECGGTGKVAGADGTEAACEYCGGTGNVRMHDAVKAMPTPAGAPTPDEDMEEMAEEMDAGAIDAEPPAPPFEKKKDAAAIAKRKDERAAAQKRRADSIARMVDRRATARAALLATASRHLDGDDATKLGGKPDVEIKRAVVAKLAPHLDAAKLDERDIFTLYAAELARADANGGSTTTAAFTASDVVRAGVTQPANGARKDTASDRAFKAADAKANAWQKPREQPKV